MDRHNNMKAFDHKWFKYFNMGKNIRKLISFCENEINFGHSCCSMFLSIISDNIFIASFKLKYVEETFSAGLQPLILWILNLKVNLFDIFALQVSSTNDLSLYIDIKYIHWNWIGAQQPINLVPLKLEHWTWTFKKKLYVYCVTLFKHLFEGKNFRAEFLDICSKLPEMGQRKIESAFGKIEKGARPK